MSTKKIFLALPIDNGAEPFKGAVVLAHIAPAELVRYAQAAANRTNQTWLVWFDEVCDEWALLPAVHPSADWQGLGLRVLEPANLRHRRAA